MENLSNILSLMEVMMNCMDDGFLIFSDDQKIQYISQSALNILELKELDSITDMNQVTGLNLKDVFPKNPSPLSKYLLSKSEHRITVKHGYKDLLIQHCRTQDDNHSSNSALLMLKDITDKKKLSTYLQNASNDMITNDPTMLVLLQKMKRVAKSNANILLQGASGTGKTHMAKLIHKFSQRSDKPLITLNCAAIPEQLIEAELFGHIDSTSTSDTPLRLGRFKYADGGTLLLDEIGEIPYHLQAKLLRAIQEQQFEAVGSDQTTQVDVRIIASSNQNLLDMVNKGTFRADLYYRLAVIPLYIPTLKERSGDIPLLISHFCNNLMSRGYSNSMRECSPETLRLMMNYSWPGNVRELENAVEHAIICAQTDIVTPDNLPIEIINQNKEHESHSIDLLQQGHDNVLRNEIINALKITKGNKTKAAHHLGVDRSTLWRRMRKLDIQD